MTVDRLGMSPARLLGAIEKIARYNQKPFRRELMAPITQHSLNAARLRGKSRRGASGWSSCRRSGGNPRTPATDNMAAPLFVYTPARLFFSPAEQELLTSALLGEDR